MRCLIGAPLTWLGAILVVTDVRAWVSNSELGWFAGIATTLLIAAIALLAWTMQPDWYDVLVFMACAEGALTSLYLIASRVLTGDSVGPRIAGALIALTIPLAPGWLYPLLFLGLLASQSYLAIVAAALGLAFKGQRGPHPLVALSAIPVLAFCVLILRPEPMAWSPRLDTWIRFAWPAFLEHPWNGWGPGAWAPVIQSAQRSAQAEYLSGHAHSDLMEWAVEYGLLGLGLVAGFIAAAWSTFVRSPVRGALVASGVLSLGLHVWHIPFLMPWLALLVGMGLTGRRAGA